MANVDRENEADRPPSVPYGDCPNCQRSIPLEVDECSYCRASFGKQSAWTVQPNGQLGPPPPDQSRIQSRKAIQPGLVQNSSAAPGSITSSYRSMDLRRSSPADIFAEASDTSEKLSSLVRGQIFNIQHSIRVDGEVWTKISTLDGLNGFIPASTLTQRVPRVILHQPTAEIRSAPSGQSEIIKTVGSGFPFYYLDDDYSPNQQWNKVIDLDGNIGYLRANTGTQAASVISPETAKAVTKFWGPLSFLLIMNWMLFGAPKWIVDLRIPLFAYLILLPMTPALVIACMSIGRKKRH